MYIRTHINSDLIKKLTSSVIESREDVASSKIKIGESFRTARAIATLCFSPPDNFRPRSPTCKHFYNTYL